MQTAEMEEKTVVAVPLLSSTRIWLAVWGFLGCTFIYMLRFSFSVAIVCMTYEKNVTESTFGRADAEYLRDSADPIRAYVLSWLGDSAGPGLHEDDCDGEIDKDIDETGEFDWSRQLRGTMSSSFFWGYVATQLPAGWLAQRYGGKKVIFFGIILAAVTSLFSPVAARLSPYALIVMRFINGVGQGGFFPGFYSMVGNWAPQNERAMMDAIFLSGAAMGSMLSFALSGVICADLGWQWIFYIYGILTLLWTFAWWYAVFDTPSLHPRISAKEKEYVENMLGTNLAAASERPAIPWRGVLTSVVLWAIVVNDFCVNWATYTGLTSLPQYMEDVLKFDIKSNGFYSALPQLAKFIMSFVFAFIGDWVLTRRFCGVTRLRKIMHTFAMLVPMCFVIGVGFLDCNQAALAIVFLTFQEAFNSAIRAGSSVTRIDMAPRFSGVIMGICNTSGNMAGIVAPIVVSSITADGTRSQWQAVFYLSAAAYLLGWLCFTFLTNSEEQEWAKVKHEDGMEMTVKVDEEEEEAKEVTKVRRGSKMNSVSPAPPDDVHPEPRALDAAFENNGFAAASEDNA